MNFIFIDYENVHPENLEPLDGHNVEVLLFSGHKQTKIPTTLAYSMQKLGYNARYVPISGGGRNALDFHIAFYAGELSASHPDAYFHIVSRDTGFDPLIAHLKERDLRAARSSTLLDLPFVATPTIERHELIRKVVANLKKRGASRPRKVSTLTGTLASTFCTTDGAPNAGDLIGELARRELIKIQGNDVKYLSPIVKT